MRKKSNEPNFDLKLPGDEDEDSDSNYWVDSLSDSRETVVEFSEGDRHGTASNRRDPVEDSQEDSEEEEASDTVMRVKEVVDGVSDEDIKTAI